MSEVRLEPFTLLSPPTEASDAGSAETIDPTITTRLTNKAGVLFSEIKSRLASITESARQRIVAGTIVGATAVTGACGTEANAGEPPHQTGPEIMNTVSWDEWVSGDPTQPDCEGNGTWQQTPNGDVVVTPGLYNKVSKANDHPSTIVVLGGMSSDGTNRFVNSFVTPGENSAITIPSNKLQKVREAELGQVSVFAANTPQEQQEQFMDKDDAMLQIYADALGYNLDLEDGTLDQANVADYNDTRAQSREYSSTCLQVEFVDGDENFIVGGPGVEEVTDTKTQTPAPPTESSEARSPNTPTQEELQTEYTFIDNLPSTDNYSSAYSVNKDGGLQINVTIPIPADLDPSTHKDYFQYERDLALAALNKAGVDLNTIDVTFTPA